MLSFDGYPEPPEYESPRKLEYKQSTPGGQVDEMLETIRRLISNVDANHPAIGMAFNVIAEAQEILKTMPPGNWKQETKEEKKIRKNHK